MDIKPATVYTAIPMAEQWLRDFNAWVTDPGSGIAPGELLGRAAGRIEHLLEIARAVEDDLTRSVSSNVWPAHD